MIAFCRIARRAMMLAAFVVSGSSFAQTPSLDDSHGPRWACWYESTNLTIRCLLSRAPAGDQSDHARQVNETIDRRLPVLVRTIWANPEQLAGRLIHIPLWNTPYDMKVVGQLAESVMCGARANCSAHFDANTDGRAPVRALATAYGVSEETVLVEARAQGLRVAEVTEDVRREQPAPSSSRRRRAIAG